MAPHSALVGGSIAKRRIECPASFQEALKAPQGGTSVYAEQGTAMHDAMAYWHNHPDADLEGMTFNDIVITAEHLETLLIPAWDAQVSLQELYGGGFKLTHQEIQVAFPGIPGAFGTIDTILESASHFLIVDYKFGAGVFVPTVDDLGDLNAQLLFYLAGAKHLAKGKKLVIAIVQPAFPPGLTHAPVSDIQLAAFEIKLHEAVALSLSTKPPRARGEHCRFAPCKLTCPLWSGPLLDLSALGRPVQDKRTDVEWGAFLASAKRFVDSALAYQKDIDSALMDHLKAGGTAPGFALKVQVKNRKWLDDTKVVANQLAALGLSDSEIWQHKLQTFAVTDAAAKRRRVTIPDSLRPRPQSNDLTLTYAGDPQAVDVGKLALEFSTALKQLERNSK
jgi:hypothetical protein